MSTFRELLDATIAACVASEIAVEHGADETRTWLLKIDATSNLEELYARLDRLDTVLDAYADQCDRIHPDNVRSILDGAE